MNPIPVNRYTVGIAVVVVSLLGGDFWSSLKQLIAAVATVYGAAY